MSWFNWLRAGTPAPIDNDDKPSTAEALEAPSEVEHAEVPSVMDDASEQPDTDEPAVTAAEVYQAFHSNQVAAEDRFRDGTFLLVGEVRSVQRDLYGHAWVNLVVNDYREQPVLFSDEARDLLAKLEPGAELRVRVRVKESGHRGDVKLEAVEAA